MAQIGDTIYITHPSVTIRKLQRTSDTSWSLSAVVLLDGPYLAANRLDSGATSAITLTPSAGTGAVTLTASSALFTSDWVGRYVRMQEGSTWGYGVITGYTSTTVVDFLVLSTLTDNTSKSTWRLGKYYPLRGYPGHVNVFEDRLVFSAHPYWINEVDLSNSNDFENFADSNTSGTGGDTFGFTAKLYADTVQQTLWTASTERGLLISTAEAEWMLKTADGDVLTPTNGFVRQLSSIGGKKYAFPAKHNKSLIFAAGVGRQLFDMSYFYEDDGYRPNDLSELAEHIPGRSLIEETAVQGNGPFPVVWMTTLTGELLTCSYQRNSNGVKAAWSSHPLGNTGENVFESVKAYVQSVVTIPSNDGGPDEVWISVIRRINGTKVATVEVLAPQFLPVTAREQADFFHVDCGVTIKNFVVVESLAAVGGQPTKTQINSTAHGLSNGDLIRPDSVDSAINGTTFTVADVTTDNFTILFPHADLEETYDGIGGVYELFTSATVAHLDGVEVGLLADGAALTPQTVTSSTVSWTVPAAKIHIGLNYNSDLEIPRLEAGAADGTSFGKTRRIHRIGIQLYRSLNLLFGTTFDTLTRHSFRKPSTPMNEATPLFTGIESLELDADYDFDNSLCFRQDQPLPMLVQGIYPQLHTQDRN